MDDRQAAQVELRPLGRDDLPELLALAHAQGRNVHKSEYERFVGLEGAHGFALRHQGKLVGALTTFRSFENGFLGPLLLAPAGSDAIGLSLALLGHAVESLQRTGVNLLDAEAGEAERPLLAGMGFRPVRGTLVLEREATAPGTASSGTSGTARMQPYHLLDVGALDASAVGHGRKEYLLALMEDHPEGARVVEKDGEVAGYALARRARRGYHLGPLVTREGDLATARALLAGVLESVAGWPVVALAPEESPLVAELKATGFSEVGRLTRMRAGSPGRETEGAHEPVTEWLLGGRLTG